MELYQQWTVNGRMEGEKLLSDSSTISVRQLSPTSLSDIQKQQTMVDQTFQQSIALSEVSQTGYRNPYSGSQTVAALQTSTLQKVSALNFSTGDAANRATNTVLRNGQFRTPDWP